MTYCRSLRFDDKPDYSFVRRMFRDLFYREGFETDFVFDWTSILQAGKVENPEAPIDAITDNNKSDNGAPDDDNDEPSPRILDDGMFCNI